MHVKVFSSFGACLLLGVSGSAAAFHEVVCTLPPPMKCVHYHGGPQLNTVEFKDLLESVDEAIKTNEEVLRQARTDAGSAVSIPEERKETAEKYVVDLKGYRQTLREYGSEVLNADTDSPE
jgi:hypothetical protein